MSRAPTREEVADLERAAALIERAASLLEKHRVANPSVDWHLAHAGSTRGAANVIREVAIVARRDYNAGARPGRRAG